MIKFTKCIQENVWHCDGHMWPYLHVKCLSEHVSKEMQTLKVHVLVNKEFKYKKTRYCEVAVNFFNVYYLLNYLDYIEENLQR